MGRKYKSIADTWCQLICQMPSFNPTEKQLKQPANNSRVTKDVYKNIKTNKGNDK